MVTSPGRFFMATKELLETIYVVTGLVRYQGNSSLSEEMHTLIVDAFPAVFTAYAVAAIAVKAGKIADIARGIARKTVNLWRRWFNR